VRRALAWAWEAVGAVVVGLLVFLFWLAGTVEALFLFDVSEDRYDR